MAPNRCPVFSYAGVPYVEGANNTPVPQEFPALIETLHLSSQKGLERIQLIDFIDKKAGRARLFCFSDIVNRKFS